MLLHLIYELVLPRFESRQVNPRDVDDDPGGNRPPLVFHRGERLHSVATLAAGHRGLQLHGGIDKIARIEHLVVS